MGRSFKAKAELLIATAKQLKLDIEGVWLDHYRGNLELRLMDALDAVENVDCHLEQAVREYEAERAEEREG